MDETQKGRQMNNNKLREFWIYEENGDLWASEINWNDDCFNGIHVREVVELKTEELSLAAFHAGYGDERTEAFEAGARWAIAKMRGEAE